MLFAWGCLKNNTLVNSRLISFLLFCLSLTFAANNYTYFGSMDYMALGKLSKSSNERDVKLLVKKLSVLTKNTLCTFKLKI